MKSQGLIGFFFFALAVGVCSASLPLTVRSWFQPPLRHMRSRLSSALDKSLPSLSTPSALDKSLQSLSTPLIAAPRGGSSNNRRRSVFKIAGSILVGVPLLAEAYGRLGTIGIPSNGAITLPSEDSTVDWSTVREATIVFHGAGGQDDNTDSLMKVLKQSNQRKKSYSGMVDWSKYSKDTIQAGPNGLVIGRDAARQLLAKTDGAPLERVHIIGISVGAFASEACAKELKKKTANRDLYVQQTTLDPFQSLVLNFGWGKRNLGKAADYAQQYLNTDDPVPSTNAPLPQTVCYDVTPIRPPEIFGHDWPLVYYARHKDLVGFVPDDKKRERGVVITISS